MQKQLSLQEHIKFHDVPLEDEFPISFFRYTQTRTAVKQLHYHNAFEIGICLEGSGVFFVDNLVFSFKKGDVSFVYPNQPHIAKNANEIKSEWYFITVDIDRLFIVEKALLSSLLLSKGQLKSVIGKRLDPSISRLVLMLLDELDGKKAEYREVSRLILKVILQKLLRIEHESSQIELSTDFTTVSPALSHIASFYAEEITIEQLAKCCHLSQTHFRVVFKKATGHSPLTYLTDIRMKIAKTLLSSTKLPIVTVSENVGYKSLSSFNRTFKQWFNTTPSEYRRLR